MKELEVFMKQYSFRFQTMIPKCENLVAVMNYVIPRPHTVVPAERRYVGWRCLALLPLCALDVSRFRPAVCGNTRWSGIDGCRGGRAGDIKGGERGGENELLRKTRAHEDILSQKIGLTCRQVARSFENR